MVNNRGGKSKLGAVVCDGMTDAILRAMGQKNPLGFSRPTGITEGIRLV
jgi:hypothetical protein